MRMSCNGCRILRKGCSDDCIIKPCLDWINSADSQANATLFLAKFYGRAGLINLIEAGPPHLRPAIFKSLLYEACGRIVDPISGSVGLLWSGKWEQCQAAVDAVLKGKPIKQNPPPPPPPPSSAAVASSSSTSSATPAAALASTPSNPPLKIYDIRHVSKDPGSENSKSRLKRSWNRQPKPSVGANQSRGKALSHEYSWLQNQFGHAESREDESIFSVETVEGSLMNRSKPRLAQNEVGLELTLGLPPINQ